MFYYYNGGYQHMYAEQSREQTIAELKWMRKHYPQFYRESLKGRTWCALAVVPNLKGV